MEIIEDLGLARRIKRAGLAQRVAFGRGLVSLHWASGIGGLVGVMTKNLFSAFRFYIWLALLGCLWLLIFCVAPAVGLFFTPTRIPAILTLAAVVWAYRLMSRHSGISTSNALFFPLRRPSLRLHSAPLHAHDSQTGRRHLARHPLPSRRTAEEHRKTLLKDTTSVPTGLRQRRRRERPTSGGDRRSHVERSLRRQRCR